MLLKLIKAEFLVQFYYRLIIGVCDKISAYPVASKHGKVGCIYKIYTVNTNKMHYCVSSIFAHIVFLLLL